MFALEETANELCATSVCGGRRFGRKFNKRDFPLLGNDEEDSSAKAILLSRMSRERMPKKLSTTVTAIQDRYRNAKGKWFWPTNGADLVYPNIYLGDVATALCIGLLKEMGVTGVVNAAQGVMCDWNYVNTKESYYSGKGISFLGVPAIDLKWYPIHQHFEETVDFMDNIINKQKGTVLVHCVQGISRSATLVIAYLILKKRMTIEQAVQTISRKRFVAPNEGFTEQLIELNDGVHGLHFDNSSTRSTL